ncbi:ABC transporter permease [Candidatus Fermentibacteria bacterium]|nr:ABC transporter permease [Candidatus Fermentibacteria bacterium]
MPRIWLYRHLLIQLARRDLKARYKNSVLGVVWSLLHPFLMMMVLAVVFSYVGRFNEGIPHYPAYILCGYLPWLFVATSLSTSVRSVVDAASLMHKVAFPREVLPLAVVLSNGVNFVLALIPLLGYLAFSGIAPGIRLLMLPGAIVCQVALLAGLAMFVAAANVYARDVGVILEVVLFGWFYLCPVFYAPHMILDTAPRALAAAYFLNPMATLMMVYRSALMNIPTPAIDLRLWGVVACALSGLVLLAGWGFFSWRQRFFLEEL